MSAMFAPSSVGAVRNSNLDIQGNPWATYACNGDAIHGWTLHAEKKSIRVPHGGQDTSHGLPYVLTGISQGFGSGMASGVPHALIHWECFVRTCQLAGVWLNPCRGGECTIPAFQLLVLYIDHRSSTGSSVLSRRVHPWPQGQRHRTSSPSSWSPMASQHDEFNKPNRWRRCRLWCQDFPGGEHPPGLPPWFHCVRNRNKLAIHLSKRYNLSDFGLGYRWVYIYIDGYRVSCF